MIIHKFGGASIKDANSIKNLTTIIKEKIATEAVIVLSAMGKTTNGLETVVSKAYAENSDWKEELSRINKFHYSIIDELFENKKHIVFSQIINYFQEIENIIKNTLHLNYDKFYDCVVSYGELISTCIVYNYLLEKGVTITLVSATDIIKTDNKYREARVDWESTGNAISIHINNKNSLYLTQGFIGSSSSNNRTTLGREGSDYSAAILGNILDATEVRIWKDVKGLFNADPKLYNDAILLPRVSYRECVELAYYGARVIHPRTIKPLSKKQIPLYVQSFLETDSQGTIICGHNNEAVDVPCYILKSQQCLATITPSDLGFMAEHYVENIIKILKEIGIRVNLMQSSAVNLTICVDYDEYRFMQLLRNLRDSFEIRYNTQLELLTISNYSEACITEKSQHQRVLLTQKSRRVVRMVFQSINQK